MHYATRLARPSVRSPPRSFSCARSVRASDERRKTYRRQPWPRMRGTWLDSQSWMEGRTRGQGGRLVGRMYGCVCGRSVRQEFERTMRGSVGNHAPSHRSTSRILPPPPSHVSHDPSLCLQSQWVNRSCRLILLSPFRSFNSRSSTANITSHPSLPRSVLVRPSLFFLP